MDGHDPTTELSPDLSPPAPAPMVERDEDEALSRLGNQGVQRVLQSGVQASGGSAGGMLDEAVGRAIADRQGRGSPLSNEVQADMEGTIGAPLDGVNVHTGSDADSLNKQVGARAFTAGDDIFFSQGTYDPSSSSGRELLAHELTHVVQQREGTSGLSAGQVSDPGDHAEREAADVGRAAASMGQAPTPTAAGAGGAGVARQAEDEMDEEVQMAADPAAVAREEMDEMDEEVQMAVDPSLQRAPSLDEEEDERA